MRLLDTGHLKEGNPFSEGGQRCIWEDKDTRINLPPFYSTNYKVKDLQSKIEAEAGKLRMDKKISSGEIVGAKNADSLNADTIVPEIEKVCKMKIENMIFQFIDSTYIPVAQLRSKF